jgi:hypothetical protein
MIVLENFQNKTIDEVLLMISTQALNKRSAIFTFKINTSIYSDVFIKVDGIQCLLMRMPKEIAYQIIRTSVEVYAKKARLHNDQGGYNTRKIYDGFMVGGANAQELSPYEYHVIIAPIGPDNITASFNIKPLASHVEIAKKQFAETGMYF